MRYSIYGLSILFFFFACAKEDDRSCIQSSECQSTEACIQGICQAKPSDGCSPGKKRGCYTGPKFTRSKGECRDGTQICGQDGTWPSSCDGEIKPSPELCDRKDNSCDGKVDNVTSTKEICDGIDNDCDGKIDNLKGQSRKLVRSCYTGKRGTHDKGSCKPGRQSCTSGKWESCAGEVTPKPEKCSNNIDDDCDGSVDNVKNLGKACTNPKASGICKNGIYSCAKDGRRICRPKNLNKKESCNNIDDDCDGLIDNLSETTSPITQPCYKGPSNTKGTGACKAGKESCKSGRWGSCVGQVVPNVESCNGQDDDCDGKTDNIPNNNAPITQTCYTGPKSTRRKGQCRDGIQQCVAGRWSSYCKNEVLPQTEGCGGKRDRDCDGINDNVRQIGLKCLDPSRKGSCREGVYACIGNSRICKRITRSHAEECNGQDDDCDGRIDNKPNSFKSIEHSCYTGPSGTQGKGACSRGIESCLAGRWSGVCKGQQRPQQEICDKQDNDCNGKVDDGQVCSCTNGSSRPCFDGPLGVRKRGECIDGKQTCVGNKWSGRCNGAIRPKTEACDGKDNDCDGLVDNRPNTKLPLIKDCYTGASGTKGKGACLSGILRCLKGIWETNCAGENRPQKELCDGLDNDCNGKTDEGSICHQSFRKLGERCTDNPKELAYKRCGSGLVCIQAEERNPQGYCYQSCSSDGGCKNNRDDRKSCAILSSTIGICIAKRNAGSHCDVSKGYFCGSKLFCDNNLNRCRLPNVVPRFAVCEGETNTICQKSDLCIRTLAGASTGYCLQGCSGHANSCPNSQVCVTYPDKKSACVPLGSKKADETCGSYGGPSFDKANGCAKNLLCVPFSSVNPYGICFTPIPKCDKQKRVCPQGRVCIPIQGAAICAKLCGSSKCKANQTCAAVGPISLCLPKAPIGTLSFGSPCKPDKACVSGLECVAAGKDKTKGYCSKQDCKLNSDCPSAPKGSTCTSLTTNGRKFCQFKCKKTSDCPTGLTCSKTTSICTASS